MSRLCPKATCPDLPFVIDKFCTWYNQGMAKGPLGEVCKLCKKLQDLAKTDSREGEYNRCSYFILCGV